MMQELPTIYRSGWVARGLENIGPSALGKSLFVKEYQVYDDNAPLFFCEGISGISGAGPNTIVSFALNLPSPDNKSKTQRVNLRIAIPTHSLAQGVDFIAGALKQAAIQTQPVPSSIQ